MLRLALLSGRGRARTFAGRLSQHRTRRCRRHVRRAHAIDAVEYRRMFGLRALRPLVASGVSEALRRRLRRRLAAEARALVEA